MTPTPSAVPLDPVELRHLALLQSTPAAYVERRVEYLELRDDYHYNVTVSQQLTIPRFADVNEEPGTTTAPRGCKAIANVKRVVDGPPTNTNGIASRLIPLGFFTKMRLPELSVTGSDGSLLPVLTRQDQGRIATYLFLTRWKQRMLAEVPLVSPTSTYANEIWPIMEWAVERIVTSRPRGAYIVIYRLWQFLDSQQKRSNIDRDLRCFLLGLLAEDDLWQSLAHLARSRLLVARMPATAGETHVVTIRYTEPFVYHSPPPKNPLRAALRGMRRTLGWLGMTSVPFTRIASNLGQAAGLWIIYTVPDGLEPIRCFWKSQALTPVDVDNTGVSADETDISDYKEISVDVTKGVVGKHVSLTRHAPPGQDMTVLDIQPEPSSAFTTAILLAVLLWAIGYNVYRWPIFTDKSAFVELASLFSAIPAAIAGALAYRGHSLIRRVSQGPRRLLAALTTLAAFLTVAVGLHHVETYIPERLGEILSIYSFSVTGVFAALRFAPRWRRSARSRWKRVTEHTTPARCRFFQTSFATVSLVVWLCLTGLVAYGETSLRTDHHHRSHVSGAKQ